jgi:hypothetical protein
MNSRGQTPGANATVIKLYFTKLNLQLLWRAMDVATDCADVRRYQKTPAPICAICGKILQ